jgi:hypothetical protein
MGVVILAAYRPGTRDVFQSCLESVFKYTDKDQIDFRIIYDKALPLDIEDLISKFPVSVYGYGVQDGLRGSFIHGTLLNQALKEKMSGDYLLTLDSDCFPVASGWLDDLIKMLKNGAGVAGILYPWQPIPIGVMKGNIERRIREKHCWNNTHVACQLTKLSFVYDNNIDYMANDDTGFMVPCKAHELGLPVTGFKLTRCCKANDGVDFNPEFNRHVCLVYGDKVFHYGGATQTLTGYKIDRDDMFSDACRKVLENKSADWLLDDSLSHKFKLDREEEIADFKMRIMYAEMVKFLEVNDRLFNP